MYDNKNNKNNSQLNQIDVIQDVTQSKKKETFIVLYERYLLDGNLDLLDKLFYAFFVSLHNQGCVINISNEGLAKKIKIKPDENISIRTTQRSLQKLEDLNYIKRYINKKTAERIIVPVFKFEAEHPEQNIEQTFHDRHGNVYKKIGHVTDDAGGHVTDGAHDKVDASSYQICHTYNKDNNKDKEKEIYKEKEKQPQANKSPIIQFLFSNNPFNFDEETLKGYLEMRKSIKKPLTEKAWFLLIKEIQKAVDQGIDPNDCINEAILRSWQGFKCEWLQRHSEAKIMQPRAPENSYNRKETASTVPFYNSTEKNDKPRTDEQVKSALQATKNMLSKLKKNVP